MKRRYSERALVFQQEPSKAVGPSPEHRDHQQRVYDSRPRKVSFSSMDTMATSENSPPAFFDELTDEICRELWYQKDELVTMKKAVRVLLAKAGHIAPQPQQQQQQQSLNVIEEDEAESQQMETERETVIGLGRFSYQRSQYKRSAIYYVMAAQQECPWNYPKKPAYIRAVSRRCTGWARQVATEEGFANFCEVYGDPIENLLNTSSWEEDLKSFNDSFSQSQQKEPENCPPVKKQKKLVDEEMSNSDDLPAPTPIFN